MDSKPYIARHVIGIIAAILLVVISFMLFNHVAPLYNGMNGVQLLQQDNFDDESRLCILYMLSTETICLFFVPAIVLLFTLRINPLKLSILRKCELNKKNVLFTIFAIVLLSITNIPAINLLSDVNTKSLLALIGEESASWKEYLFMQEKLDMLLSPSILIVAILAMGVVPAICEELFFRGLLQTVLLQFCKNKHVAILIIALIFSVLHGDNFNILPRFVIGIYLGYVCYFSGNILYPMLIHCLHNSLVAICTSYPSAAQIIESIGTFDNSPFLGVASFLLLFIFLLWLFRLENKEKNNVQKG